MPQTTDDILGPAKEITVSMAGVAHHPAADIGTTDDVLGPPNTDDILGRPSEAVVRQATQKAEAQREEAAPPPYPSPEEMAKNLAFRTLGRGQEFVQEPGVKIVTPQSEAAVRKAYGEIPGGAIAGAGSFLQGLTSPMAMGTMGLMGGAGPRMAQAANYFFSAQMLNSIAKASPDLAGAIQQGRWGDAAKLSTAMGLQGLTMILGAKAAMKQPPQPVRTPSGDIVQPNGPVHPLLEGEAQQKVTRMGADAADPQDIANVYMASKGLKAPKVKVGDVPVSQTGEDGTVTVPPNAPVTAVIHEMMHAESAQNPTKPPPPEGHEDATAVRFLADHIETPAVDPAEARGAFPSPNAAKAVTAGLRSQNHAIESLQSIRAEAALRDDMKAIDALPEAQQIALYDQAERDPNQITDPRLKQTALAVEAMLSDRWTRIQRLRGQDDFIENYLPHIYEDPEGVKKFFLSRQSLRGDTGFLQQRVHDYASEAIAAGYKLLSPNLVKLGLLRMAQLDKYEQALLFEKNSKELGTMVFRKGLGDGPEGWSVAPEPLGTVKYRNDAGERVIAGYTFMPKQAADLLARDLSPGIANRGGFLGDAFDAYRQVNAALNSFQLGASFFHVMTTAANASIIDVVHGLSQIGRGELGAGALSTARGLVPLASSINNVIKAAAFKRQVYGDGPMTGDLMSFVEGGARVKMDSFYAATARKLLDQSWKQAWENGDVDIKMRQLPGQVIRAAMWPIMEWWVPMQKMGATITLMQDELARLGKDATDPVQRRYALGKAQQLVDNAMGQVVYDNWFWNRTAVQVMQATIRSLGWTGGSLKLFGGAAFDTLGRPLRAGYRALAGPKVEYAPPGGEYETINRLKDPLLTLNMKYVMGLAAVAGLWGAGLGTLLMRLRGHKGWVPETPKDVLNPPSGIVQPDGTMARLALPLYTKDIASVAYEGPQKTAVNKLAPLLSMLGEAWNNKDFYGTQVRNEDDPIYQQGLDLLRFAAGSSKPFSFQGIQRAEQQGFTGPLKYASQIGITPAPRYINETPMQRIFSKYEESTRSQGPRTKEAAARSKLVAQIEDIWRTKGQPAGALASHEAYQKGLIAATDQARIASAVGKTRNQARFARLPIELQIKALNAASPQERAEVQPEYAKTYSRIKLTQNEAQRKKIEQEIKAGSQ